MFCGFEGKRKKGNGNTLTERVEEVILMAEKKKKPEKKKPGK